MGMLQVPRSYVHHNCNTHGTSNMLVLLDWRTSYVGGILRNQFTGPGLALGSILDIIWNMTVVASVPLKSPIVLISESTKDNSSAVPSLLSDIGTIGIRLARQSLLES